MSPDDPRHGTNRGYVAGCRADCCRHPHMVYMKQYRLRGGRRMVPALGTNRRIQALEAIGWSKAAQSRFLGRQRDYLKHLASKSMIHATTADAVAAMFERYAMVVPVDVTGLGSNGVHERTRRDARAKGYAPPLAWDDIDDPDEQPRGMVRDTDDIDEAVVLRILAGDNRVKATPAERAEVCRRWAASGRSLNDLERLTGWATRRYFKVGEDAA